MVCTEGVLLGGLLRLAATLGRCRLQCTRFARLHIVATAAHFLEDTRLHNLLFERFERPIDLVTFVKLYFDHLLLPEKGRNGEWQTSNDGPVLKTEPARRAFYSKSVMRRSLAAKLDNVFSCRSLLALNDIELNALAFGQGLEALGLNG